MDKDKIIDDFNRIISSKVTNVTFNTWFKDLKLLNIDLINNIIYIYSSSDIYINHIVNNYFELIDDTFSEVTGKAFDIKFTSSNNIETTIETNTSNIYINDEVKLVDEALIIERENNLKSKYKFENFVVGDANRVAYSSCLAVAQNPGKLYNPLFIYGKSGLGKTHLMHAIGNYIVENSNLKVLYISTDDFMNEFINITKDYGNKDDNLNYIELFKTKYRNVDVLMIDDIQFLGRATATQMEFTNTFNSLYNNDKQIIICSDRSVDDLKLFEDRLKTRFNWGLKTTINPPEYELKIKIIKNKIKSGGLIIDLDDKIIDYIASNCGNDVRNLEGAITRLYAYQATWGLKSLTYENALEALIEYSNNMIYTDNSISKIIATVANYYNITVDDIKGKKRNRNIAYPRMIAMYLCRILTEETLSRIGLEFGGKDHTTIIHGHETINDDILKDSELSKKIDEIKLKISE